MMKWVNIKYFVVPIVLISTLILSAGCGLLPNIGISPTSPPATNQSPNPTLSPVNPTYTPPPPTTPSMPLPSVADVVAKVRPSVVAINTEVVTYDMFNRPFTQKGAGSGWIIDSNGLIVTNNHVVEGAKTVTVTLEGGQTYTAKTIRTDSVNDLAVIDVGVANLPAATIGDSSKVRVGDFVVAIGNALGQGIRATLGIISNNGVTLTVDTGETLYNLLETTAAINPGNSGGPLVNMAGEVIGITSAKLAAVGIEGMGYAISSNTASPIIQELIQKGYVSRAWLGVTVYSVSQFLVMRYNLPVDKGAFITQVAANSPADEAGLKAGDVIVSLAGKDIATADDLVQAIRSSKIGQQVEIIYWRDNNKNTTAATLIQNPAP